MSAPLLEVIGLSKAFPIRGGLFGSVRGRVNAVNDVSFAVAKGEAFGLAGESGSGKSTIARMILGLLEPSAGAISFEGRDFVGERNFRTRSRAAQMVFQNPGSSLNPRRSIGQSIAVPLVARGLSWADVRRRVDELLALVQLSSDFAARYPYQLSGGQKQRVAIARAIAAEPKLVVLDEPTSALDVSVQAKIIELLDELRRTLGLTYVFISHDLSLMRSFATRVGVLYLGRLIEVGDADRLFGSPAHPYTRALLSVVPVISEEEEALRPREPLVEGEIPSPANMPTGCAFHPRCPRVLPICQTERPNATRLGPDHFADCHLLRPSLPDPNLADPNPEGAPKSRNVQEITR